MPDDREVLVCLELPYHLFDDTIGLFEYFSEVPARGDLIEPELDVKGHDYGILSKIKGKLFRVEERHWHVWVDHSHTERSMPSLSLAEIAHPLERRGRIKDLIIEKLKAEAD